MTATTRLAAAALAAALTTLPAQARADSLGWKLCIPGAFKSCHSIQITTTPVVNGSNVRTGTVISFILANLQGTHAQDNTLWSRLVTVSFRGPAGPDGANANSFINGTPSGVATGPAATNQWGYFAQGFVGYPQAGMQALDGDAGIGGCTAVPTVSDSLGTDFTTCGGRITFSITSAAILDASDLDAALISADLPGGNVKCVTDLAKFPTGRGTPTCTDQEILSQTAVPEPISITLLGTGLVGVGAVRARRKRREPDA